MPTDESAPQRLLSTSSTSSEASTVPGKTAQRRSWTEWWQAAKTIKPDDYRNLEKVPCMKQSLMYGIAGGTAIGCTRYLSSNPFVASNWAVASFVLISAASWRRCRSIQATQKEQIQIIREQLEKKVRRKVQGQDSAVLPGSTGNPAQEKS